MSWSDTRRGGGDKSTQAGGLRIFCSEEGAKNASVSISEHDCPFSCSLRLKASTSVLPLEVPAKYDCIPFSSSRYGDCWILNTSSLASSLTSFIETGERALEGLRSAMRWLDECGLIRDSMSIFSSFSSRRSFSSLTSDSRALTLSSKDSV